ncbi:hypothetical protein LTR78_003303 [Recurvomyces mirabilis]|uniref:Uncharacterized protein n=1 Tax=Recurvomyces mirabilis TaxID=574656 RepID=A0AAE0WSN1_9PEZI|nr:hypothetical protein LTR78_003303 [Recurvomyces mirabilis]KAK5156881.1 hypothetical protein LTS14_004398 [Recurvomyces mirabilis]
MVPDQRGRIPSLDEETPIPHQRRPRGQTEAFSTSLKWLDPTLLIPQPDNDIFITSCKKLLSLKKISGEPGTVLKGEEVLSLAALWKDTHLELRPTLLPAPTYLACLAVEHAGFYLHKDQSGDIVDTKAPFSLPKVHNDLQRTL